MSKVLKYIVLLNLCLALTSLIGGAWVSRSVGSNAYIAAAWAAIAVGFAASLALLISYLSSQSTRGGGQPSPSAISGVLLSMLVRMGLPMLAAVLMMQAKHPLMEAGFFGLLAINYLVALPIETLLSLQFVKQSKPAASA